MIDNNFQLVYANKSYLKFMKEFTGEEMILNKSIWIDGLSDEYIQKWENYYSKCLKGEYFQIEEQLNHFESNKPLYNQITIEPLIGEDNLIFGVSCQSKDITTLVNQRNESEQRYNALIHEGHDMIAIINPDGNYSYCNPTTTSILGFGPEKFIGKNINEFIHPDDIKKITTGIQNVISESKVVLDSIRFQNYKLEWRCMEMILTNMLENPYVNGIVINSRDITEERKLRELNRQVSEIAKIGSWEIDIVKKTLFWSEIVHELHGTNSQSFVPDLKILLNFFRKDFRQMVKSKIKNSIKTGKPFDFEAIIVNKNNEELWTRAVGHTIFENGKCIRVIGGFQDINLRKKAEIKLHESENRFKTILEAEPECIKLLDREGKLLMMNPAGLEMIEADNEAIILGNQVHEIVLPEHRPAFLTLIKDVLKGKSRKLIFEIKGLKGTKRWLETHAVPMRNELGAIISILAVTRDITERTTIEKEKNSLLLTLENSLNEIYIFDAETYKYSFVNKGALHNLGYLESEIKTLTPFDINSDIKLDSFNELVSPLLKGEKEKITLITNHKRKDGSVYPVEVHLQLVIEDKAKRFLANILDITERKKNKEIILLSNERFEKVTEATNDAIWDWDIVNQTIYRSKAFERFFGKKVPDKIIDNRFWNDNFHPDDVENFKTSLSEAVADPSITRWWLEFRVINKQKKVLFVIDRGIIIRDSKGKAIRMVGAMTDITEQKQMTVELSELNEALQKYTIELERSNKELEQFAFVASHDLQEPLRMISSFMELFLRRYGHEIDENGKKYIHLATDGAKRMKQLMLDLLQYSRASRPQEGREQIDLKEVIIDYKRLRRKVISEKSAAITFKNLPTFITYKAAITQIMHCILDNALKYSKENSPSKIEINCQENDQEWIFSIKDNGIGIDSQFYEKIFVIFQRLHSKEAYSGTGIGLSVAKRHVEFLGGKIWLESVVGEGSTFYFTIPKTNN
ncbi:sensory transduction histidine kinase [Flavobacteria bacterium BAL38]|nr:sensory transduction histidine kinase [Flavobacteria bacterium BAL38]